MKASVENTRSARPFGTTAGQMPDGPPWPILNLPPVR
jgi:hypothetical protein